MIIGTDEALYGTTLAGGTNGLGSMFRIVSETGLYSILHSLSASAVDGRYPTSGLLEGVSGALYGCASQGGPNAGGVVFALNRDGTRFQVLHSFGSSAGDGVTPKCQLIAGTDGDLFGTTAAGGEAGVGTVFRLKADGSSYRVLHSFMAGPSDGATPEAGVLEGANGVLYGTTSSGGATGGGVIFKLNTDGTGYEVVHHFGIGTDGSHPKAALIKSTSAILYGTTAEGGMNSASGSGVGVVFSLDPVRRDYQVLHRFGEAADGQVPEAGLLLASDGLLYGTTTRSGDDSVQAAGSGTIFSLREDGADYRVVYRFNESGSTPGSVLVESPEGGLFGTTRLGAMDDPNDGTVFRWTKEGDPGLAQPALWTVHAFETEIADRWAPYTGLIEGSDGTLYGVTSGLATQSADGGAVFKLNRNGSGYRVLHLFDNSRFPDSKLLQGRDGVLYGTATGWAFKLNRDGSDFKVLYDGPGVSGGLVEGRDGALYGITTHGGTNQLGSIFRINKDGSGLSVLFSFTDSPSPSGRSWPGGLIQGADGALYGKTSAGGGVGFGTVFTLNTDGTHYRLLHEFGFGTDGCYPWSLVEGSDGVLYGSLQSADVETATIFKLRKDGTGYETLIRLERVISELAEGRDGFFYGDARSGPEDSWVKVFRLKKNGTGYTVLHQFEDASSGVLAPVLPGLDGALYGTTFRGGAAGAGSVFKLLPPETPEITSSGEPGAGPGIVLRILGASGGRYQLLRSIDLETWSALPTFTMPAEGAFRYRDNSPTGRAAFYRVQWIND